MIFLHGIETILLGNLLFVWLLVERARRLGRI